MRRHVWKRVVPRRRVYIEILPGVLLAVTSVGVVSAAVANGQISGIHTTASAGRTVQEQSSSAAAHPNAGRADTPSKQQANNNLSTGIMETALGRVQHDPHLINTVDSLAPRQMWFISTPTTTANAKELAQDAADKLLAISRSGMQSLAVMEPTTSNGDIADFGVYTGGGYDASLRLFYQELKNRGITDGAMGMWVIMPEANMPEWGQADPAIVSNCIARTARIQKEIFPSSLATVMFNSETYPGNDTSYSQGQYKSLVPYVQSIPKGLIDSFGLQGFPWARAANQPGESNLEPKRFLRVEFAVEAARSLGVGSVWLNTGSFAKMYAHQPGATVVASSADRQSILNGIRDQAKTVKASGMSVAINMFTEDKSRTAEGTDWSFQGADASLLQTFSTQLQQAGIGLWRF